MAGPVRLLHLAFAAAVTPSLGRANCSAKNFEPGWLSNYDGNLGAGYRVRLTLTASQNEVSGLYFYASQLKDIRIAGWISEEKLALNEFDKDGRITARFEGAFADRDPRGVLKGILRCEVIVGNWHGVGAAEKLPFYLHLDSATAGSLSRRYGAAGAPDDELVHRIRSGFGKPL